MDFESPTDRRFSHWLVQRRLDQSPNKTGEQVSFSIAIESSCNNICQPQVAPLLAAYLNEFDDTLKFQSWFPIDQDHLDRLQDHPEFWKMFGQKFGNNSASLISHLAQEGGVIFELEKGGVNENGASKIFQVSLCCQEPRGESHHLWINAKRVPEKTLIPMIANAFLDWAHQGGDRKPKVL